MSDPRSPGSRGRTARQSPAHKEPSDGFYRVIVTLGRGIYNASSRPLIVHPERAKSEGGLLLVSNHTSPYDATCLMYGSRRPIDWISVVEFRRKPIVGWLFGRLNALFLDRAQADSATLKDAARRLRRGRMVGIFPEAEMRTDQTSAITTGTFYSGFGQLALLGRVPILPAVVLGSTEFSKPTGWLPWPRTRWGAIFGEPISVPEGLSIKDASAQLEREWLTAIRSLELELRARLDSEKAR